MVKRKFDYEEKHRELQDKMNELLELSKTMQVDLSDELELLTQRMESIRVDKYKHLTPWEQVLLSRHIDRPTTQDYINYLFDGWVEMHGDRCFGDDSAIVGGIARFNNMPVTIIGHQKGKDTRDNVARNFGMPHPEGYRKVQRLLLQAAKFNRPVITFVDTPGAHPGIGAEERGQAWAISQVLMTLSALPVPVVAIVIGEGGSGGALALAVADRILMLSNAVFSVASPEACASILWKDADRVEEAAAALKLSAPELFDLMIIDQIIEEPAGGAHLDFETTAENVKQSLIYNLETLISKDKGDLIRERYERLRRIGNAVFLDNSK